jgi:hypothetical protein
LHTPPAGSPFGRFVDGGREGFSAAETSEVCFVDGASLAVGVRGSPFVPFTDGADTAGTAGALATLAAGLLTSTSGEEAASLATAAQVFTWDLPDDRYCVRKRKGRWPGLFSFSHPKLN